MGILNKNSDIFIQPDKPVKQRIRHAPKQVLPNAGLGTQDCKGTHEQRQEWMRKRQAAKSMQLGGK